jgi:hypothetical protein
MSDDSSQLIPQNLKFGSHIKMMSRKRREVSRVITQFYQNFELDRQSPTNKKG